MRIQFNNFPRETELIGPELDAAAHRVIYSGWYILGPELEEFERNFASFSGAKYAVGVGNGYDAIKIALRAAGLREGDDVITSAISAAPTPLAIVEAGGVPVFVDVDKFGHIDAKKIPAAITSKTRAIVPVHLYGNPCEIDEIMRIALNNKLAVVEDCAQAHGSSFKWKKVGLFGTAGAFSFYPTKNLGGIGDCGAIITDDKDVANEARELRNYGEKSKYEHARLGVNSRLDEIHAALLSVKLRHLEDNNRKRVALASLYLQKLHGIHQIRIFGERKFGESVWHLFVIEAEKKEELRKYLKDKGVDTLIHYPLPLHKQKCFAYLPEVSLPVSERMTEKIVSLPLNPFMETEEVEYVCDSIRSFYA